MILRQGSDNRNTDLIHPVGHSIEDHPGSPGGADHDVLALRSVSVVNIGPEHIGDTGPLGPPHGQLQGELGRGLTGGRRGRPSWPAPAQSLDQLIQVWLELGSFPSGDVVKVVLGQETVAEKSEKDGKKSVSQKVVTFRSFYLCGLNASMTYFWSGESLNLNTLGLLITLPGTMIRPPPPPADTMIRLSSTSLYTYWVSLTQVPFHVSELKLLSRISWRLNGVLKLFLEN